MIHVLQVLIPDLRCFESESLSKSDEMSVIKSTRYAPDIFRSLNGVLLIHKPADIRISSLIQDLKCRMSDDLNQLEPRPLSNMLRIEGGLNEEKRLIEVPNLADHPLVVGPRYNPWEIRLAPIKTRLGFRSSGLCIVTCGDANRLYHTRMTKANLVSVYQLSGRFGFVTDTFFHDGKIQDKTTYHHIRSGRVDSVLSRIESTQYERLFDSSKVPLHSQEAYELAKSWPSRPPKMAKWPVIYRIRCIHLKVPEFKVEVTCSNENEEFLAQLVHEIGIMLKSGAYTESIRRVKQGIFDLKDCLTEKEWDLQSIVNHLSIQNSKRDKIEDMIRLHQTAMAIRV